MSEAACRQATPEEAAAAAEGRLAASPTAGARGTRYRSKDPGPVPCSLLGVKQIRDKGTMGPGSGEELVNPSKWLKAHEREPQLPQRESGRARVVAGTGALAWLSDCYLPSWL